jgi:hypothetical protein
MLDVAERLVDRIGIIQSGQLLAEGTLNESAASPAAATPLRDVFLRLVVRQSRGRLTTIGSHVDAAPGGAHQLVPRARLTRQLWSLISFLVLCTLVRCRFRSC